MATKSNNASTDKTFKISQLSEITNLDDKDLFLVSDYEGGKCYTKKLTYGKLMNKLANNPELIKVILEDDQIEQKIDDRISSAVVDFQTISGGNAFGDN